MAKKKAPEEQAETESPDNVRTYVNRKLLAMVAEMKDSLGCRKDTDALHALIDGPIREAYAKFLQERNDKSKGRMLGPDPKKK